MTLLATLLTTQLAFAPAALATDDIDKMSNFNNAGDYLGAYNLGKSFIPPHTARSAIYHYQMGNALEHLNRLDEAQQEYKSCISLRSGLVEGALAESALAKIEKQKANATTAQSQTVAPSSAAGRTEYSRYVQYHVNFGSGQTVNTIPSEPALKATARSMAKEIKNTRQGTATKPAKQP